jgi:hypothetical protein
VFFFRSFSLASPLLLFPFFPCVQLNFPPQMIPEGLRTAGGGISVDKVVDALQALCRRPPTASDLQPLATVMGDDATPAEYVSISDAPTLAVDGIPKKEERNVDEIPKEKERKEERGEGPQVHVASKVGKEERSEVEKAEVEAPLPLHGGTETELPESTEVPVIKPAAEVMVAMPAAAVPLVEGNGGEDEIEVAVEEDQPQPHPQAQEAGLKAIDAEPPPEVVIEAVPAPALNKDYIDVEFSDL